MKETKNERAFCYNCAEEGHFGHVSLLFFKNIFSDIRQVMKHAEDAHIDKTCLFCRICPRSTFRVDTESKIVNLDRDKEWKTEFV